MVLPLRPEKVEAVKQQLSSIHPEIILFMSKTKELSLREDNVDIRFHKISSLSISKEVDIRTMKNEESESFTLHLSAEGNEHSKGKCSYYMWRQCFRVNLESRVDERKDIEKWAITLAFPLDERLTRGNAAVGVYAFLPTEMVTGFPFIIQSDFLLVSSRESMVLDNKWNQGILDCIPSAFCAAFIALLRGEESSPQSSRAHLFKYLPIVNPSCPHLRKVRDAIQAKLRMQEVVKCEASMTHKAFCKPAEAGTILPDTLESARQDGVQTPSATCRSNRIYVVYSCLDQGQFAHILEFFGVGCVSYDWYSLCL
eukprot:Gb_05417 [translate_table: standard]